MKDLQKQKTIREVDYPLNLIKKITPYLNDIKIPRTLPNGEVRYRFVNEKQRGYAWYYVHNNGNRRDAYRRAYFSEFHKGRGILLPDKDLNQNTITTGGHVIYKNNYIQEAIRLIRDEIENKIKADIPQTILEQLQIQATYDPKMFIKPNGSPAFSEWEEIPPEYRCCVEGIENVPYGKYGTSFKTKIKLVNRAVARKELLQIAPNLLQPSKVQLIHTTLDSAGNETGINYSKLSDDELRAIQQQDRDNK